MSEIRERLFALSDEAFGDFTARLIPDLDRSLVIGVRTPELKALAKEYKGSETAELFLAELPHEYLEENSLHAYLLNTIRDFDEALTRVGLFLPYIDNWATCDSLSPAAFRKTPERLLPSICGWVDSERVYTARFGIKCLMSYFLDDRYSTEYADMVATVQSDEYYIRMMAAWYFATALAKQYDSAVKYIEDRRLPEWTHNKAIQKAVESFRVTDEHKAYLRTLRIKN